MRFLPLFILISSFKLMAQGIYPTVGSIERTDSQINQLISQNATIEVLSNGFIWTEGPVYIADGNYWLFSDIPQNSIFKWDEKEGVQLYLTPSGYTGTVPRGGEPGSNALILDHQKRLVLCQHGDRRMARMLAPLDRPAATFESIAGHYKGKKFNSPNDAIFDSKGNLYFTDPPYGLVKNSEDPSKELPFQGVFKVKPNGEIKLITDKLARPNGIAFSPDEKILYVSNSEFPASWHSFELDEDGNILSEKVFYVPGENEGKGAPDGLKVDPQGNVWATGPGGLWIFSPEAKVLGRIKTGEATSNCAFNNDYSVLFLTCDDYIMRVKLK
jgi:gluconolactonase